LILVFLAKALISCNQGSSDCERLSAHAEVLALQKRLGLSYKDAAHRLCMAEIEKMKADEKAYKSFAKLAASTEKALENSYDVVQEVEKKSSDMS
jgi:hypothetical protein